MTEQDLTHLRQKINDLAEQDSRNSSANLGPDRAETGDAMNALRDRDLFGFIPVSILRSALPHEIGRIGSTPHNDRLPRHVPIYVDNLWEWGRPDRFPRGQAASRELLDAPLATAERLDCGIQALGSPSARRLRQATTFWSTMTLAVDETSMPVDPSGEFFFTTGRGYVLVPLDHQ